MPLQISIRREAADGYVTPGSRWIWVDQDIEFTRPRQLLSVDVVYTMSIMVVFDFEWDDANIAHLARHGITADEVEELFLGPIVRRRGGTDAPDRFRALGRTAAGRYLVVIYQLKEGSVLRAFTGWLMSDAERRVYEGQIHD